MLIGLFVVRFLPFVFLRFGKNRKQLKIAVAGICAIYFLGFLVAVWEMIRQEKWRVFVYLPLSMLPHYLCYIFGIWMLVRCVWSVWSERVWKRIYGLTLFCVMIGVLLENYINPYILQFFFKIFK